MSRSALYEIARHHQVCWLCHLLSRSWTKLCIDLPQYQYVQARSIKPEWREANQQWKRCCWSKLQEQGLTRLDTWERILWFVAHNCLAWFGSFNFTSRRTSMTSFMNEQNSLWSSASRFGKGCRRYSCRCSLSPDSDEISIARWNALKLQCFSYHINVTNM